MHRHPSHKNNIVALKRIEGQIRGIQQMIEKRRYCMDILTQMSAVASALSRIQDNVLASHLDSCVSHAFSGSSKTEREKKIKEIIQFLKTFRKKV